MWKYWRVIDLNEIGSSANTGMVKKAGSRLRDPSSCPPLVAGVSSRNLGKTFFTVPVDWIRDLTELLSHLSFTSYFPSVNLTPTFRHSIRQSKAVAVPSGTLSSFSCVSATNMFCLVLTYSGALQGALISLVFKILRSENCCCCCEDNWAKWSLRHYQLRFDHFLC